MYQGMINLIDMIHDTTRHRIKDTEKSRIYQIVCEQPAITRKGIITKLGLRPTSVSSFVSELMEQGLIYEGQLQNDGKKGRPEVELYAEYDRFVSISLYVASQKVKGVLLNIKWEVLAENSVRIPWDVGNDQLMAILLEIIESLTRRKPAASELLGAGVSFLGSVNHRTKELIFSSRWNRVRNFNLHELEEKLNIKVGVFQSLEAQLEHLLIQNTALMKEEVLVYHWGYGVGASFSSNGAILRSRSGCIMEIGHTVYDPNSMKKCICGNTGCLETECALWSLIEKLPFSSDQIPEDEAEFARFIIENQMGDMDVIKHATKAAAAGLSTLYQIVFPSVILIESPFLVQKQQQELFLHYFYEKLTEYARLQVRIDFIEQDYRGEIFGCTYNLFKKRLQKELRVRA
jgi:transcriptional regulator of PTS gene